MKKEIELSDISTDLRDFLLKTLGRDPSCVFLEIYNTNIRYLKFSYPFDGLNRKALASLMSREDFDGVEQGIHLVEYGNFFKIIFTF